jgi:Domain of unknown function (DUF1707)
MRYPVDETTWRRLRVSDADRDAVVTELSEHFQAGRLDAAELDDRTGRALRARTGSELDQVLADLPRAPRASGGPRAAVRARPALAPFLVPVLAAAVLITALLTAGAAGGGWHHGWAPGAAWWPLWWLIPLMALRLVWLGRRPAGSRPWR